MTLPRLSRRRVLTLAAAFACAPRHAFASTWQGRALGAESPRGFAGLLELYDPCPDPKDFDRAIGALVRSPGGLGRKLAQRRRSLGGEEALHARRHRFVEPRKGARPVASRERQDYLAVSGCGRLRVLEVHRRGRLPQ